MSTLKSQAVLQNEAKALYARLELEGTDLELMRKLKPLLDGFLRGGDHIKLAHLLGYEV